MEFLFFIVIAIGGALVFLLFFLEATAAIVNALTGLITAMLNPVFLGFIAAIVILCLLVCALDRKR
jgi:hypothetical protein